MRGSDRSMLGRLKHILSRKMQHQGSVSIRDVLAIEAPDQGGGNCGEFYTSGPTEPELNVINRMSQHISRVANIAMEIHLKDNFDLDSVQMKPECVNNITRLSFNEFSFYPSEKQGPLTDSGFKILMSRIEGIAKKMPENLHLLVASIPVVNEANEVHNMICYVQCGHQPVFHTFAKAIPSDVDVLYPGTANAFASSGSPAGCLISNIIHFMSHYSDDVVVMEEFMWRCLHNPDYPPPAGLEDKIKKFAAQLKQGGLNKQQKKEFKNDIFNQIDKYLSDIRIKNQNYLSGAVTDTIASIPSITLTNESATTGMHYGGEIIATTAGGRMFNINIDICLDHMYAIAKNAYDKIVTLAKQTVEPRILSTLVSQVITSATVSVDPDNMIGADVTHVDITQRRAGVVSPGTGEKQVVEEMYKLSDTHFGCSTTIIVNKPKLLSEIKGEGAELIAEHNQFSNTIQAVRQFVVQQPRIAEVSGIELAKLLSYEAASRSMRLRKASPGEWGCVLENVNNDLLKMKDNLLDHEHLDVLVDQMKDQIEIYLIAKEYIIKKITTYITARSKDAWAHQLFRNVVTTGEGERLNAAKELLDALLNNKRLTLTDTQLAALIDRKEHLGRMIFRYYNKKIDHLLPQVIVDAYDNMDVSHIYNENVFR